ncbi:MAG TPA: hypothetical protein P5230_03550 [Candidatus Magasanikbacteria bacterium]|nr:hypothetical protein [Candidatus Magasanikbacteria bacterium]
MSKKFELIKKISEEVAKQCLKDKKLNLKKCVSDTRDKYLKEIREIALEEEKLFDRVSGFIYYKSCEAAEKYIEKEKERKREERRERMERNRREKDMQKIIGDEIKFSKVREYLKNNVHYFPPEERPELPDSLIEEYFESIGYEGSIDSFDWNEWEKEHQKEMEKPEENTIEILPQNEPVVEKKIKKINKETDKRLIEGGIFGENYHRK